MATQYAIVHLNDGRTVTFTIVGSKVAWQEKTPPHIGDLVMVSGVFINPRGLRAKTAHPHVV